MPQSVKDDVRWLFAAIDATNPVSTERGLFEENEHARSVRTGFLARVPLGRLGEPEDLAGPLLFFVLARFGLPHRPQRVC